MGIFDKLKSKKKAAKPEPKKQPAQQSKEVEVKQETVVKPDGTLATVTKKSEVSAKKIKPKKEDTGNAYRVLIKPLITEKSSSLGVNNQYVFDVAPGTNKVEVKKAIKKVYGVTPFKVNIITMRGRKVRYGKTTGRTKQWKKAVIMLLPGQKIEIQEGL